MFRCSMRWILLGSFLLFLQSVAFTAWAATPPPSKKGAAEPPPPSDSDTRVARVEGFRSARFGMTEAQVLEAIRTDLKIAKDAVAREVNNLEQTNSLLVTVTDLNLPGSGPAQIAYIFVYKSKKLIQVNVLWGKPVNPTPDPSALSTAASLLRNHFVQQSFRNDKLVVNGRLEDGTLIVFRGTDEKGRMVLLLLYPSPGGSDGTTQKPEAQAAPPRESALLLSYIENVVAPDTFRIKEGQF